MMMYAGWAPVLLSVERRATLAWSSAVEVVQLVVVVAEFHNCEGDALGSYDAL